MSHYHLHFTYVPFTAKGTRWLGHLLNSDSHFEWLQINNRARKKQQLSQEVSCSKESNSFCSWFRLWWSYAQFLFPLLSNNFSFHFIFLIYIIMVVLQAGHWPTTNYQLSKRGCSSNNRSSIVLLEIILSNVRLEYFHSNYYFKYI